METERIQGQIEIPSLQDAGAEAAICRRRLHSLRLIRGIATSGVAAAIVIVAIGMAGFLQNVIATLAAFASLIATAVGVCEVLQRYGIIGGGPRRPQGVTGGDLR